MEEKREVVPLKVVYKCDRCKQGEMTPTGQAFTLNNVQFEHVCSICGFRKSLPEQYPKIIFEEKV